MKLAKRVRDTITGRYVAREEAEQRPDTTVSETLRHHALVAEMEETGLDAEETLARRLAKINQLATNRAEDLIGHQPNPGLSAANRRAWIDDLIEVGKLARGESR